MSKLFFILFCLFEQLHIFHFFLVKTAVILGIFLSIYLLSFDCECRNQCQDYYNKYFCDVSLQETCYEDITAIDKLSYSVFTWSYMNCSVAIFICYECNILVFLLCLTSIRYHIAAFIIKFLDKKIYLRFKYHDNF